MYKFPRFSNTNKKKVFEMKKGWIITFIIFLLLGVCVGFGYYLYQLNHINNNYLDDNKTLAQSKVSDECTDFAEAYAKGAIDIETINANWTESKISPKTIIKTREVYTKCGHTIEEEIEVTSDMVNMNKETFANQYQDWDLDKFTTEEILLSRKLEKRCTQHYVLREKEGYVAIYYLDDEGKEQLKEVTGIVTKYLPETDRISLNSGIQAMGKEQLNSLLEDYE